jgi:hypothetical protein
MNTTKPISQNYGLMKVVGYLYIALALLLLLGGLWLSVTLVRADFYADYRRGMHLIVGVGSFLISALLALGFYVQGSMAAAVADIDTTTRSNGMAIEATRRFGERAARSSQQAARNSDALLHAHTALQQASDDDRAAFAPPLPPASTETLPEPAFQADFITAAPPAPAAEPELAGPPQSPVDQVVQSLFARSRRPWRQPAADVAPAAAAVAIAEPVADLVAEPVRDSFAGADTNSTADASPLPIDESEIRG